MVVRDIRFLVLNFTNEIFNDTSTVKKKSVYVYSFQPALLQINILNSYMGNINNTISGVYNSQSVPH